MTQQSYPDGWEQEGSYLKRIFEFKNFVEAAGFVARIVPIAEELQHHPDIGIFEYKKVCVKTTTHDAGNMITQKDITLAQRINALST